MTDINNNTCKELVSSNSGQFKCEVSGTSFNSQQEMEEHGRREHNK
ncbi:MAG: hypothetical protein WKF36_02495 [Candidatus Nitrosocosmicus sp.]